MRDCTAPPPHAGLRDRDREHLGGTSQCHLGCCTPHTVLLSHGSVEAVLALHLAEGSQRGDMVAEGDGLAMGTGWPRVMQWPGVMAMPRGHNVLWQQGDVGLCPHHEDAVARTRDVPLPSR